MTNNRGGVTRLEETASTWTRAIVTGYDYVGRETSSSTALTDHTTISGTIGYDTTTGAVTSTTRGGVTEAFSYDTWGRTLTSTDGAGNTATTSYDTAGRTKTASDGKGSYTYSYDGTDTLGNIEHRGLATKIDLGYATGDTDAVAGAYDPAGGLVQQVLPGGYAQAWTRNLAGQATAMAYTQTVGGTTTPILGFTQTHDHLGRVVAATGPAGSRRYSYDDRARLSKVQDTGTEGCSTRVYGFTGDSNRTALATYAPDADGGCQTGTAAGTTSYSYDAADRITTTGYSYDRMGRTTTVPKAHTSNAADGLAGDLTVTYAANDMVASLQQTMASPDTGLAQARKQTFTLDGSDRVSTIKGYTDTVQLVETLNHYDSDTDSPAWTQTKTRPDTTTAWTTTWNRYIADLAGGLAIDLDNTGTAILQLTNLHGDIIATTTLGQAGINTYTETNEYGQPKTTTSARYGWLGTHQRDTSVVGGLTLMGARLYAPATGRFLSVDPIHGGNDNSYTYPADPINSVDLDGNCVVRPVSGVEGCLHAAKRALREAAACGGFCGIAGWVSSITMNLVSSDTNRGNAVRHFVWQVALGSLLGVGMARAIGDAHDWDLLKYGGYLAKDSARDLANNKFSRGGPFPVWWRVEHFSRVPDNGRNRRWDRHGGRLPRSTKLPR